MLVVFAFSKSGTAEILAELLEALSIACGTGVCHTKNTGPKGEREAVHSVFFNTIKDP